VTDAVQEAVGVEMPGGTVVDSTPRYRVPIGPGQPGFLVEMPGWDDLFTFQNAKVFDPRSARDRAIDYAELLRRSPVPLSIQEVGEILTTMDDLQDEAATLAIALALVEKYAGRAIPGVGTIATVSDALNFMQAFIAPAGAASVPGKAAKRAAHEKGKQTGSGYRGRLEELRRTGDLRLGWGDALQALQATDSMFGFGVQLGAVMGGIQGAFWTGVRGGEIRVKPSTLGVGPLALAIRGAVYRSPTLAMIHPAAPAVMGSKSLSVWADAARVLPWVDVLGEHALASSLIGLRLAENVLGPALRSGEWVPYVEDFLNSDPVLGGGVESVDTRGLRASQWIMRTAPATSAAVRRAVVAVPDRGRQAFYESLIASIGWGFLADVEPGAVVRERGLFGPMKDAFTLLDVGRIPQFDLED
jgi:hypothetical protein